MGKVKKSNNECGFGLQKTCESKFGEVAQIQDETGIGTCIVSANSRLA